MNALPFQAPPTTTGAHRIKRWPWLPFWLLLITATSVWLLYWILCVHFIPGNDEPQRAARGQFGDMFGAITSLFSGVSAVGILLLFWQIRHAAKELDFSSKWNKINATFTYFTNDDFMERERAAAIKLNALNIDLYKQKEALPPTIVEKIYEEQEIHREVKDFLNVFEGYATAVNAGAFEADCSYNLMSRVFVRYWTVFEPYIRFVRLPENMNSDGLWNEMEKLVDEWKGRAQKDDKALEEQRKNRGVRRDAEL